MKIKNVQLLDFKRFADLEITDIPSSVRLVIIAGPNGCGKSSLFDAFSIWQRPNWEPAYHERSGSISSSPWNKRVDIAFHSPPPQDRTKLFYIRPAYRHEADFNLGAVQRLGNVLSEQRPFRMIDGQITVSNNYQRLVAGALEDLFERAPGGTTIEAFRRDVLDEIRKPAQRLFPDLILNGLGNPLEAGSFRFDKGIAKGFHYKNLSAGEKAAFDLVLDFVVKRKGYDDTVFCIDEPEAHINPRLHGILLDELVQLTSSTSQLWLATHSIGMMHRARELQIENPAEVAFLDFSNANFDDKAVIQPIKPSRAFGRGA